YILLRGENVLTLIPVDGSDREWLPTRVKLDELSQRGRTEIVEVVLQLKPDVDIDQIAPEISRLLRPFGQVTPLKQSNKLIVRASVASLVRNLDVFLDITPPPPAAAPPALPTSPAACASVPRTRVGLLGRLLRR